jgi:hypothetical protein
MVIGRGRRRENPHFVLLLTKKYGKKIRENSTEKKTTEKKVREKSTEKKVREKKLTKKVRGKKYGGKVTRLPVEKGPLGWILRNFRLRMRRPYFRTGRFRSRYSRHFRSLPVKHAHGITSGSSSANMTLSVPIYYLHLIG